MNNVNIYDLIKSPIKEVRDEASKANELKQQLSAGLISKDEYYELVNDIARLNKIDHLAIDLETKVKVERAFKAILLFLRVV